MTIERTETFILPDFHEHTGTKIVGDKITVDFQQETIVFNDNQEGVYSLKHFIKFARQIQSRLARYENQEFAKKLGRKLDNE